MIPVPLWLLLAAGIAWAGSGGAAYLAGRSDGRALEQAAAAREGDIEQRATAAASRAAAEAIAAIEIRHVTVRQRVETEIRDRPVYRDCQHADRVLDDINEAITGQPARGRQLPAAGAAR